MTMTVRILGRAPAFYLPAIGKGMRKRIDKMRWSGASLSARPRGGGDPAFLDSRLRGNERQSSTLPRLGSSRRGGGDRIVRPGMSGIAPAHFSAHCGVAAAPESRQIARGLHRAMRRREKLDEERDLAAGDCRMAVEPGQLLQPDRDLRATFARIIDRHARARRCLEMDRRVGVEPPTERGTFSKHWQEFAERGREFVGGEVDERCLAEKSRGKPIAGACGERGIGKIGPAFALAVT